LWTVKINTTKINYIVFNDKGSETRSDKHEQNKYFIVQLMHSII